MKIKDLYQDDAALIELGRRLARVRIDRAMTQAELAKEAGVGKRTLERLEAGETTQTKTLIRVLRVLNLLGQLELVIPEIRPRPMYMVKEKGVLPKRAARRKRKDENEPWKWGDEK